MFQPPKGRRYENHEVRTRESQPSDLANSGLVIHRLSPVMSVFFDKRNQPPRRDQGRSFQPTLIYENKRILRRNELCDFLRYLIGMVPGRIGPSTSRNRGESIVCELENLRVTADLRYRTAVLVQRSYGSIIGDLLYLGAVGTDGLGPALHPLADVFPPILFGKRRPHPLSQQPRQRN